LFVCHRRAGAGRQAQLCLVECRADKQGCGAVAAVLSSRGKGCGLGTTLGRSCWLLGLRSGTPA
jgi:hypothetical protein